MLYAPQIGHAQTCGDIIYYDTVDNQEYRDPITNCDNPLNLVDGERFSDVSFTYEGQPIDTGSTISLETIPTQLNLQAVVIEDTFGTNSGFELYRHEGDDFRKFDVYGEVGINATGTYTLVHSIEELPILSHNTLDRVFGWLLPKAYAQGFIFGVLERTALTFTVELVEPEPAGASSVLFLPGIQASRLYKERSLVGEDQLWEPTVSEDVRQLEMTVQGESVNNIYTRDPIDEALGIIDIYDSFLEIMREMQSQDIINEFLPFAHDWRYSVFDVATKPIKYPNGEEKLLLNEVLRLADESKTGKVTIIAHSNGGLVAKALLAEYGTTELAGKIDRLVMVGTPETGAPKAIASLLHGYDQGTPINIIINDSVIREVSRNIPGAYGLLPSATYIDNNSVPLIFFDASDSTAIFRSQYANAINDLNELSSFMNADEGRMEAEDVAAASIANSGLLAMAQFQAELLDAVDFEDEIEVYSVLGTGKETEVAFEYREFSERVCKTEFLSEVCTTEVFYRPVPILSLAGDGTVPSQSSISGLPHYVNIRNTDFEHKNLTESLEVQSFIKDVIIATSTVETNIEVPTYSKEFLMIGLHSPMDIVLVDAELRRSGVSNGEILLDIPDTTYRELAGAKYITIPSNESFTVQLQGTANGGANLTLDKFSDNLTSKIAVLPITEVSSSTTAILEYDQEFSPLQIDSDGDGSTDIEIGLDGEVISNTDGYGTIKQAIIDLDLSKSKEKSLLRTLALAKKFSEKQSKRSKRLESRILRLLDFKFKWLYRSDIITRSEYLTLQNQIESLIKESK